MLRVHSFAALLFMLFLCPHLTALAETGCCYSPSMENGDTVPQTAADFANAQDADSTSAFDSLDEWNKQVDKEWGVPTGPNIKSLGLAETSMLRFHTWDLLNSFDFTASGYKVEHRFTLIPMVTVSHLKVKGVSQPAAMLPSGIRELPNYKYQFTGWSVPGEAQDLESAVFLNESAMIIGADSLQELGLTGLGIRVAIVDSGVNMTIPALSTYPSGEPRYHVAAFNRVANESQDDLNGHGTHVAAIIASNGKYVIDVSNGDESSERETVATDSIGLAPNVDIIDIKVLDKFGKGETEWVAEGLEAAFNHEADIISMSLGDMDFIPGVDAIINYIRLAEERETVIVAAAGNEGPLGMSIGSPAVWDNVISVGSTSVKKTVRKGEVTLEYEGIAAFSSRGPSANGTIGIDVVAPGVKIISAFAPTGGFRVESGTSTSTPIISGGIALLKQAFPNVTLSEIRSALLASATDLGEQITSQGNGQANFSAAYELLDAGTPIFAVAPIRIDSDNTYFDFGVEGSTVDFNVTIVASEAMGIVVECSSSLDETIFIDSAVNASEGITVISLQAITPAAVRMSNLKGSIVFSNVNGYQKTIEIDIQTEYLNGRILLDRAHDNDTISHYYAADSWQGTFSTLREQLRAEGYLTHETRDPLTSEVLAQYDVLMIPDPDLAYNDTEIEAVLKFISDGGSVLVIGAGNPRTTFDAETEEFETRESHYKSNQTALDALTQPFGLRFTDYHSEYPADAFFANKVFEREDTHPYAMFPHGAEDLQMTYQGSVLVPCGNVSDNYIADASQVVVVIDPLNDSVYTGAAHFVNRTSRGRIFFVGSTVSFADNGYWMADNAAFSETVIDWLVSAKRPFISSTFTPTGKHDDRLMIRESFRLEAFYYLYDLTLALPTTPILRVTLIDPDGEFIQKEISYDLEKGVYALEFDEGLPKYGNYTIYIPARFNDGSTAMQGMITCMIDVQFWDSLSNMRLLSQIIIIALLVGICVYMMYKQRG